MSSNLNYKIQVGIIMGSKSDLNIMQDAADILKELGVGFEMTVVSAHRTPERMFEYAKLAASRGLKLLLLELVAQLTCQAWLLLLHNFLLLGYLSSQQIQ